MERISFAETKKRIITSLDIVRALGSMARHAVLDQFQHETPSEHFRNPDIITDHLPVPDNVVEFTPRLPFDSEGNWHNPDGVA